ncbi:MAG TPA: hypothetical protein EYG82_06905 [Sulfurovum sp.]|nr:hypothetical protein [Sulfurovum sp.]
MVAKLNINSSYQYGARKNIYKSALTSLYNKKKIWNQLKFERQLHQKNKALTKNRFTFYKKIYTIDNVKYYKVIGLDSAYYIEIDSLTYTASSQFVVQLCYYTVNGMKYKRALLKTEQSKDEIFISENTLSIAFNSCKFESIS